MITCTTARSAGGTYSKAPVPRSARARGTSCIISMHADDGPFPATARYLSSPDNNYSSSSEHTFIFVQSVSRTYTVRLLTVQRKHRRTFGVLRTGKNVYRYIV